MQNSKQFNKKQKKEDPVIKKIKELIPEAPSFWKSLIAHKMGVSEDTVSKYIRGDRGKRNKSHKDVLRYLIEIVDKEKDETNELLKK